MHYTIHHDKAIDARIASDVALLRERLLGVFPQLGAIILVGGFGRGEGSVIIEEDGNISPINDYDLVVISDEPLPGDVVARVRKELATELDIWWVDISTYTVNRLRWLRYRMYVYDLKYGSQVLYGDSSLLSLIPDMAPEKMPLVEAEIQFFTRLWCFLGPFRTDYVIYSPDAEAAFFLTNQMCKAVLACADALLIVEGLYHHSYRERRDRFLGQYGDRTQLAELVRWAFEFKLRPTTTLDRDPVALWRAVRSVYLQTWREFACRCYPRFRGDWGGYVSRYRWNSFNLLRRLGHLILRRSLHYERKLRVDAAQLYLLLAFDGERENVDWLARAKRQLGAVAGRDLADLTWDRSRALAADLRMEV